MGQGCCFLEQPVDLCLRLLPRGTLMNAIAGKDSDRQVVVEGINLPKTSDDLQEISVPFRPNVRGWSRLQNYGRSLDSFHSLGITVPCLLLFSGTDTEDRAALLNQQLNSGLTHQLNRIHFVSSECLPF